jgi:hypothetical protein
MNLKFESRYLDSYERMSIRGRPQKRAARERLKKARGKLLLPGALLVTIQAQLLAPFMLVDFCLAAFFD